MTIRLGILLCDTPIPAVRSTHGTYLDIFRQLLQNSLERTRPGQTVDWSLDGYDVVQQEYPTDTKLAGYDALLISGSAASAYAPLDWTPALFAFISKVVTQFPRIRIFGICFGQQAIAMALGGTVIPNPAGWEVGTYDVQLTSTGALVFGRETVRIQEMHRDHVPSVPAQFELLGSTPKCPVQGIALSYKRGEPIRAIDDIHILAVQGHPEFVPDIVHTLINAREASGVLNKEMADEARIRADAEHDGVDVIAKVMWDILIPATA